MLAWLPTYSTAVINATNMTSRQRRRPTGASAAAPTVNSPTSPAHGPTIRTAAMWPSQWSPTAAPAPITAAARPTPTACDTTNAAVVRNVPMRRSTAVPAVSSTSAATR